MGESTHAAPEQGALMVVGPRRGRKRNPRIEPRDFRRPAQPTGAQLRELEGLAARIGHQVRETIENMLKTPADCQPAHPAVKAWGDVVEQLDGDVWALPLIGEKNERAALFVDPRLQRHMIQRLLGGGAPLGAAAQEEDADAETAPAVLAPLGDISRAALVPLIRSVLKDLAGVLREEGVADVDDEDDVDHYSIDDTRRRTAPRRWMRAAEAVTEFRCRLREGDGEGDVTLVVQSHSLAHLLRAEETSVAPSRDVGARNRLETMVRDLGMTMSLRLGGATIDLAEFLRLQAGDVLVLDQRVGEPLDVMVGAQKRFVGQPGRSRGRLAVRIIGKCDEKEST